MDRRTSSPWRARRGRATSVRHLRRSCPMSLQTNVVTGLPHVLADMNSLVPMTGPQRVRDLLPDEADELLKGRVQVVNVWRPIKGPLQDSPLAVCDATTIRSEDLVPSDLVYPHRVGETYSVKYNPEHQWFYVPQMRT